MDREKLIVLKNNYDRNYIDSLTSVYNRKFFNERMKHILLEEMDVGQLFTLVLLNVDDFAHYNEMNGYERGDQVLQQISYLVKRNLRGEDYVIRFDGDEFLIILLGAPKTEAFLVAERLRKTIEAYPFAGEMIQPTGNLTISLGIASYPEDGESIEFLLKRADTALLIAKEKMKNRVEIF